VTLTFGAALAVGALLFACGLFTAAWRRDRASLTALPMLAAGAAVCAAAAGRISAPRDPVTGQELAVLVLVVGLATAVLGAAWSRAGEAR
jgi:hypothetical protein